MRSFLGLLAGVSVLGVASLSHAQCSKDTDCKGDRVCEGGACVAPPAGAPAAAADPAAPPAAAPAAATAPMTAPAAQPPLAAQPVYEPAADEPPPVRLKPKRHSTGMMAGGIVMVSFTPIALLVSLVANAQQNACESGGYYYDGGSLSSDEYSNCDRFDASIYGGALSAVVLLGVGIPLIVIGGKREPAVARVTPWASPQAAGLKLNVDL
jgi:hypothetical protein